MDIVCESGHGSGNGNDNGNDQTPRLVDVVIRFLGWADARMGDVLRVQEA